MKTEYQKWRDELNGVKEHSSWWIVLVAGGCVAVAIGLLQL